MKAGTIVGGYNVEYQDPSHLNIHRQVKHTRSSTSATFVIHLSLN